MIKVLIADDHPIVRKGLRQMIEEALDMVVAAEAATGGEALALARAERFDVLVLDLTMPDGDGIEVLGRLRAEQPDLPVLIISMHPEDQYAVRLLQAGAAGYLSKKETPEKVVVAIRTVVQGKKFFSAHVAQELAKTLRSGSERRPHERLSEREFQIMRLIVSGLSTREIATQLSLSENTVRTYRTRLFKKMGLKREADLVRYALQHGLIL